MSQPSYPTTAVLLTPPGRGAVATVRLDGPQALSILRNAFRPRNSGLALDLPKERILLGEFGISESAPGEEVVVCRTADQTVEIHCHGGKIPAQVILETLESLGARPVAEAVDPVAPDLFDPICNEAWAILPQAPTLRTAAILLDQAQGALSRSIAELIKLLAEKNSLPAKQALDELLQTASVGRHLVEPFRVALVGPTNVGKSSLLNALAGFRRAIVQSEPGTTRDVVRVRTALEGWPVEFCDTAGLRSTLDPLESAGIVRTRSIFRNADLVLLVRDATLPPDLGNFESEMAGIPCLHLDNKSDLAVAVPRSEAIALSALTGQGLAELTKAIVQALIPSTPGPGQGVLFLPRHREVLESVRQLLQDARIPEANETLRSLLSPQ